MAAGYRIFNVTLKQRIQITPSLLRCVFTGDDVLEMKHESPDQRIKLLFAGEDGTCPAMPVSEGWYQDYLALPKPQRPVMRTYTLRGLRREQKEMDVEFVLHGETGPASRWAMHAGTGAKMQIVAPNAASADDSGGYEWIWHEGIQQALLIADETAVPAAVGILEQLATLAEPPKVQAFFEVPHITDAQQQDFPFAEIHWLGREDHPQGTLLMKAIRDHLTLPDCARVAEQSLENKSLIEDGIWERAEGKHGFNAWVAAESGVVKKLRHCLIDEFQLDREVVNFMAYWTLGRGR